MTNDIFGECDCSSCNENTFLQEQEDILLEELGVLVAVRDSLNMANMLEESPSEPGENEFSFESRRLKLGMMHEWERSRKKDWYFAPTGLAKNAWDEKPRKKKQFQFARC
jgi:hypothetical protein